MTSRAPLPLTPNQMSGTYFSILPQELHQLLAIYYYGPLEITVNETSRMANRSVQTGLFVRIFVPDGTWEIASVLMTIPIDEFIFIKNRQDYQYKSGDSDGDIHLIYSNSNTPHIKILIRIFAASTAVHLNAYYTSLFFEKLAAILRDVNYVKSITKDKVVLQSALHRFLINKTF